MGIAADFVIIVLAELGVALLLFPLGLEVSLKDLRPARRTARQVTDMPGTDAVWLGAMVSLSSTMVVLTTLAATHTLSTLASRVMLGMLVGQDLAVVPILIMLPQIGATDDLTREMRESLHGA